MTNPATISSLVPAPAGLWAVFSSTTYVDGYERPFADGRDLWAVPVIFYALQTTTTWDDERGREETETTAVAMVPDRELDDLRTLYTADEVRGLVAVVAAASATDAMGSVKDREWRIPEPRTPRQKAAE
jgi:hypothetical protein